ncbi:DUF4333 domain-containing protein [Mycobacteroides abscessus]|uniref:Uncharacterized protein n=1 Tax=Mycobacteroides abscessus TaxID=36809 RepID=A0A0U0YUT9_9MYCO|nr:DUF4333 domain-containing protein [Mycobacteroides abscessus]SKS82600.1 Uncharacterised protein [Mycobacteroides abscessus subsp. abscessus]MBE5470065.1 hypothetical protein [Mycobacteroides abscessus]MBL3735117.1 DUF4333 domain-containing protein [Mycobacteroides abscessus subsp. massiliense]MBL3743953.1 DUF4333 domain-containing protein [Mycobacteroides abscessus subsp. massiliense]MBL3758721.1 DUF4333 domain-containing protein [Mycobacteroides abscessus subsp. massiliense]
MRFLLVPAATVALAAILPGCSSNVSVSAMGVSKEQLADQTKQKLTAKVGVEPKSVVCDGPLDAKVGATQRCVLTAPDDSRIGVTVTASKVEGSTVEFDIQVDNNKLP